MPLENASFINQLEPNNPTVTDGISQGDDHLRLIKTAIKGSFPNFSGSAVQSSEAQLDAGAAVAETGAHKLADAGAFFNTNNTDGVTNPAAGEIDVQAGGNAVVKLKSDKSAAFQGDVTAVGKVTTTGPITGPGAWPIGMTGIWWSDTLPAGSWGTFAWCNGAEYPRSNTNLFSILGTTFGTGDGSTTANLPDLRDKVSVGKSGMGGATALGLFSSGVTGFVSSVLGAIFGAATHVLTADQLAAHDHGGHTDAGTPHSHNIPDMQDATSEGGGGTTYANIVRGGTGLPTAAESSHTHPISSEGLNEPHNNVQPSIVCNYVIRVA